MDQDHSLTESLGNSASLASYSYAPSVSIHSTADSLSCAEPKMPDVIQRKFLKLSSTLKETSRYLNDIDRVVFEHKNLEKQRNEEIFQLKADLHSTLERLQVADVSIAADHVMEMGVNKHTPSLISDEEVIEEEDRPDCSSLISNQVSQKKSNELECDSKAFEVKYNALNEKYIAMKKKARKIIQNWKEKYRSAEIIIEKQEKIIGDLHTMNIEMSESKSKLQDEVDSFTEKTVTACYSVERIGELENKMLFISERHKIFLKEIEDLKVSLHQENLVVKETKQQNNVLNLNINASEKANEDLKKELALSNESLMKLQNEKLTLDFKGQTLQKSLSEKENQILEMDKRLEDLKKDVESSKESVITDKEYLNILRSFNNELDIATELISKNSKETFQAVSCSPSVLQDVRVWVADAKTKFKWLQEEIRLLSLRGNKQFCQKCESHNASYSQWDVDGD